MRRSTRGVCTVGLLTVLAVLGLTGAAPTTESWDAVYLANSKIGHIQTWIEPVKDRGRELLRVRIKTELSFRRLKDPVTMKLEYGSIETLDGKVLRLDTRTVASDQELRVYGDVIDGKMKLIFDGTGQRQEQVIDWPDDVRGPYAAEQSLARQPIKPGESRTLKMFMPDLNKVCEVTLNAKSDGRHQARRRVTRLAPAGRPDDHQRRQGPPRVRHDPLGRFRRPGPQVEDRHHGRPHLLPDDPARGPERRTTRTTSSTRSRTR